MRNILLSSGESSHQLSTTKFADENRELLLGAALEKEPAKRPARLKRKAGQAALISDLAVQPKRRYSPVSSCCAAPAVMFVSLALLSRT